METGTTRFEELKKEILIRAHKAEACREQYGRAYGAETLDALMEVVRDNFDWFCNNDVLDGDIIDRYKAEFNAGKIWHNEARVTDGMLLLDNSRAELLGNSRAVLRENSRAVLLGNSRAVLWENSRAVLWENSSAELRENSRAELRDNSRAELRENSRAELRENSSAELWENSRAELRDNSRAVLWENSSAELWENSYGISYSIKECKLHDHAIYRIRETNEVRYVDENIRFVKVEDTKGIDLTKCHNCRFRAVVDGKEKTGRVQVIDGCIKFWFDYHDELNDTICHTLHIGYYREYGIGDFFNGFEIVPRNPETYKDWQVGDIVGCLDEEGDMDIMAEHLCKVIFRSGELVAIAENYEDADINGVYTCSQMYREGWRLILTDIEKRIIEKRKEAEYEPQDGDIVAWKDKEDDWNPAISIYKDRERGYATIYAHGSTEYSTYVTFAMNIIRPATEDEKQRLFDAMAKEGKCWNAEKKRVEDIPKPYEFKKGEPVLVRDDQIECWVIRAFLQLREEPGFPYLTTDGNRRNIAGFKYCLPYNEKTMHLLGTTEDYEEE